MNLFRFASAGLAGCLRPRLVMAMGGSIDHAGVSSCGFSGLGPGDPDGAGTRPPYGPAFCQALIVPLTCRNAEGGTPRAC